MKTGRKPKPAALKIAEGNVGHRVIKPGVDVLPGAFEPSFPLDGIARAEWDRIINTAFWLRETDSTAIADRCLCFQRMLEAEQDIRARGLIVEGTKSPVPNPSIRVAKAYRLSLQRYDSELGLTASSRGRVDGDSFTPPPAASPGKPTEQYDSLEWALCRNRAN